MTLLNKIRRRLALAILPKPRPSMVEKIIVAGKILDAEKRARILMDLSAESLCEVALRVLLWPDFEVPPASRAVRESVLEELCQRVSHADSPRFVPSSFSPPKNAGGGTPTAAPAAGDNTKDVTHEN